MVITILIPHFKTVDMTTYTVNQLVKFKGKHKQKIIVIDNSGDCPSFGTNAKVLRYPQDRMQSHGIAFDFAMPHVTTEYFITIESDSFPTRDWLDYYENLINEGYDAAGSIMKLSGGIYMHPAGAMYKTSDWLEASQVKYPYTYFPNVSTKGEPVFAYHLMVHNSFAERFAADPEFQGIELHHGYKYFTTEQRLKRATDYEPSTGVFHNGMGMAEEWLSTYGKRTAESDASQIGPEDKGGIIHRVGYEPGQWFHYYMVSQGKRIFEIPTEVKWMQGRENQQQEYTLMENGFKHLWGVTAYHDCESPELMDVINFKRKQAQELFGQK